MAGYMRKGSNGGTFRPIHRLGEATEHRAFEAFYWQDMPHDEVDYSIVRTRQATAEEQAAHPPSLPLLTVQKLKQYVKYGMDMERVMYLTGITKPELIHFAKSCGCYARLYANTYYR